VLSLHPRCLQPQDGQLVDGYTPVDPTRGGRSAFGDRETQARSGLVHHSDSVVRYTFLPFGKRLEEEGLVPSMGRVGSAYDNAAAESFVVTLKTKLLYRSNWPTQQVVRPAIFEYIEGFHNTRRSHSTLGHLSSLSARTLGCEERTLRDGGVSTEPGQV
jgi:transposase InsO family protein